MEDEEGRRMETGLVRQLASSSKKARGRALDMLEQWLLSRPHDLISEEDLRKIWKGLFYCVWHSDKLPVQTHLINNLSSLIISLNHPLSLRFFQVFLLTIRREWAGIDQLRLDKFYLMIRKFLRSVFRLLHKHDWDPELVSRFMDALIHGTFLSKDTYLALGVNLHLSDVFLKEVLEFLPLENETLDAILRPMYEVLARSSEKVLINRVRCHVFGEILEYGKKLLRKRKGDLEYDDGDERVEKFGFIALNCDVWEKLFELATADGTPQFNRKQLYSMSNEFKVLENILVHSGIEIELDVSETSKKRKSRVELNSAEGIGKDKKKKKAKKVADAVEIPSKNSVEKSKKKQKSSKEIVEDMDLGLPVEIENAKVKAKKIRRSKKFTDMDALNHFQNLLDEENRKKQLENGGEMPSQDARKKKRKVSDNNVEENESSLKMKVRETSDSDDDSISEKDSSNRIDIAKIKGTLELHKNKSRLKRRGLQLTAVRCEDKEPETPVLLSVNGDLVSNLQKEFEKVSAQLEGEKGQQRSPVTPPQKSGVKKKKVKTPITVAPASSSSSSAQGNDENDNGNVQSSEKSVKKVRFSMKNNLVWKPHSPLPPENLRVPPSATPRGSALKKGVPPGPIRPMIKSPSPLKERMKMAIYSKKRRVKTVKSKPSKIRKAK